MVNMNRNSKTKKVLEHLQNNGSITSLEAIELYGATRLSSIIYNLKKYGCNIKSIDTECVDRFGNKTTYSLYVLK